MLGGLRRREVIGGMTALGVGFIAAPGTTFARAPSLHCVVQESGALSNWPLVVAAVVTDTPDACNARIEELRGRNGYTRAFKLSASDPARIAFGKAMIGLFAREPGLRLRAEVVTDANHDWPADVRQRDERYFARYRSIVHGAITASTPADVRVPRHDNKRGELLLGFLRGLDPRATVEKEAGPASNLAQLAGLLAACIRADKVGTTDIERLDFLNYCKTVLGVSSLTAIATNKLTVRDVAI
jgi:hypothetical protein